MKKLCLLLLLSALFPIAAVAQGWSPWRDIPAGIKFTPPTSLYDSEEALLAEQLKKGKKKIDQKIYSSKDFTIRYEAKKDAPPFNLNQDLSKLNMEQVRNLKYELYARKGYLFHDAGVRAYFNQFEWYQPLYWINGLDFSLTPEEEAFLSRVKLREQELVNQNYIKITQNRLYKNSGNKISKDAYLANTNNVINFSQYKIIPDSVMKSLKDNGFAITKANHQELYYVYEENDYQTIPSFITTDIYLQLFHAYFTYALRKIEEDKFVPIITELSQAMYSESKKVAASKPQNKMLAEAADFNQFFYAVPVYILTGKKQEVPAKYKGDIGEVLRHIDEANFIDEKCRIFDGQRFDYSLFKPRGNYDRTEKLRKYFKAMMWLQSAPSSLKFDSHIARMMFTSYIISTKADKKGKKLIDKYMSLYEPTSFLMGQADELSAMHVIDAANNLKIGGAPEQIFTAENIGKMRQELIKLNPRKILPGGILDQTPVINFMPQRYNPDGDMMSRLVDVTHPKDRRPFPKGLDVFATMGNQTAEQILLELYKEGDFWSKYPQKLKENQAFFANYDLTKTFYERWLGSLNSLFTLKSEYPYFMHLDAWEIKNLNTALSSWAELKHDAILYAKQPVVAECGGGDPENFTPPPPPRAVGYVEPNIEFWNNCLELLKMTREGLDKYKLLTPDLKAKTLRLEEYGTFLRDVSDKELKRIALTDKEYETIRIFGSSVENLTKEFYDFSPDASKQDIEDGFPIVDEEMAIIADVFTSNNECLEVGVGRGNEIYVIVEIEGYLYLTKGAVFNYYEFTQPVSNRLTDGQWREMLDADPPKMPVWLEMFILPEQFIETNKIRTMPIEVEENYNYSSGC